MRKKLHLILLFLAITFLSQQNRCIAQEIYANGSIDRDSILAGQTFNYKIDVEMPDNYIVDWNYLKDTISKNVEIIKKGEFTTTPINGGKVVLTQNLVLTTFDTGYVEIPPIGIRYSKSKDDTTTYTCFTNYKDIYVNPVEIDTTMSYKHIKMPIKQNITVEETLPYIGGVIILAVIILLVTYLIRRSKSKIQIEEEVVKPQIPAINIARERLSKIKESNQWQSANIKEFYTDLTDIVREYLEGQFNIDAIEMTSDEILQEVMKLNLDNATYKKLQDNLTTADFVKFAKANPAVSQNEAAFNEIAEFVEESYIFYQELKKSDSEKQEMEETK